MIVDTDVLIWYSRKHQKVIELVPILIIICAWCNHRRISKAIVRNKKHYESIDFNLAKYTEIANTANWQGISLRDKQRLFMSELG